MLRTPLQLGGIVVAYNNQVFPHTGHSKHVGALGFRWQTMITIPRLQVHLVGIAQYLK